MSRESGRAHWSKCAPSAQFFKISAVAFIPWLVWFFFITSLAVLGIAIGVTAFLVYIQCYKKLTLGSFFRSINIFLTGRLKSTKSGVRELNQ